MQAVSIGPWVLSVGVVALLLALGTAHAVAAFLKRRGHPDVEAALWWLLALALVTARAAWVVHWWPAYRASPLAIVDIRDGGFIWAAGLVALVFATLVWAQRRPAWRRALPISVGSGVAGWALVGLVAWQLQSASHPPLPDLALRRLDGGTATLADLGGKPMVINLWATWCPPCRAEMPMLVEASQRMPDMRFVFVNQGEAADTIRAFFERERLAPAEVLVDGTSGVSQYYRAPGYPTTLFVDASGHLRDMRVGPLSEASLRAHLERIVPPAVE